MLFLFFLLLVRFCPAQELKVSARGYFDMPGLHVMVFTDIYPEGHQGGVGIIQNGTRVATNGDLRLEPTPGQWQPIPKVGAKTRVSDKEIQVRCWYPDSSINRKGFNPVVYPDLNFAYTVRVVAEGSRFRIIVDLDAPLPEVWEQQVGFNLELFPGLLFGKSWYLDGAHGLFNTQPSGPMEKDLSGNWQAAPLATGKKLTVAPGEPAQTMIIESLGEPLQLLDGRLYHNNGWFVVRSLVAPGKTRGAAEWLVDARVIPGFTSRPVIHVSQVGYHPGQEKVAVVETDATVTEPSPVSLLRYNENGETEIVMQEMPISWGKFLRFNYFRFDFSAVREEGVYRLRMGEVLTEPFRIGEAVYEQGVWQPTLEYFLPVQMCHMRVNEGYRVWHGLCHMDDALMAPTDTNHFDGYLQGPSTLTRFSPWEQVPGLNAGGWHDAGDYDLRAESQAGTVWVLAMIREQFRPEWDMTLVDQQNRLVEIHHPDGKDDLLQQIGHGLLTLLGGYENLGRLYRGIICNSLRQYVLLGDGASMTDGLKYNPRLGADEKTGQESGLRDDRWVFTEENPGRELEVARALAAAARVMRGFDDSLARRSLATAIALYAGNQAHPGPRSRNLRLKAAIELLLATGDSLYGREILALAGEEALKDPEVVAHLGRVLPRLAHPELIALAEKAAAAYKLETERLQHENPFGIPYRPQIWGDGWNIQQYGVRHYFLHTCYPAIFDQRGVMNALHFILGNHPGENTSSFVSGVGSRSVTVAYGVNRADWSFIPGGSVSGTGIIRPDFPELKVWPYFWQQTEYVMGGGATNFLFLVLAARDLLK